MMSQQECIKYNYIISRTGLVGPAWYGKITSVLPTLSKLTSAAAKDFQSLNWPEKLRFAFQQTLRLPLDDELQLLEKHDIHISLPADDDFPASLMELDDAPFILYRIGQYLPQDQVAVAIVGSRRQSSYGEQIAFKLARELAQNGFTIVSGLAYGNDATAHQGALKYGRTIGVLACGLLRISPRISKVLAQEIVASDRGCVFSEFHPFLEAQPFYFPFRNRLISGLSKMVVVIEASNKSGTIHTASEALKQGKEVGAVPGDITREGSAGPLRLIKDGAVVVSDVEDVLNALGQVGRLPFSEIVLNLDSSELLVHQTLVSPLHPDDLSFQLDMPICEVINVITNLELKGLLKRLGDGRVVSI